MKEMLEKIWYKYDFLNQFNRDMLMKGHNYTELTYVKAQIDILAEIIKYPTKILLNELLRTQTNYRLNSIIQGEHNLLKIMNYPEGYVLNNIEDVKIAWRCNDSLIFDAKNRQTCVFSPISNVSTGQRHIEGKWQNI